MSNGPSISQGMGQVQGRSGPALQLPGVQQGMEQLIGRQMPMQQPLGIGQGMGQLIGQMPMQSPGLQQGMGQLIGQMPMQQQPGIQQGMGWAPQPRTQPPQFPAGPTLSLGQGLPSRAQGSPYAGLSLGDPMAGGLATPQGPMMMGQGLWGQAQPWGGAQSLMSLLGGFQR